MYSLRRYFLCILKIPAHLVIGQFFITQSLVQRDGPGIFFCHFKADTLHVGTVFFQPFEYFCATAFSSGLSFQIQLVKPDLLSSCFVIPGDGEVSVAQRKSRRLRILSFFFFQNQDSDTGITCRSLCPTGLMSFCTQITVPGRCQRNRKMPNKDGRNKSLRNKRLLE